MKALIIDDEVGIRLALAHFLRQRGYEALEAATGEDGLLIAQKELPEIVFLDQRLPDMDGDTLLARLIAPEIGACVIMMTAYVDLDHAVRIMKEGAEYFFPKPFDLTQLALILESIEERFRVKKEVVHFRNLYDDSADPTRIIGFSPHILRIQRLISLLARNLSTPVLIFGESGCGKELVAKAIHQQSGVTGPLIEINSASLSETLLESELFGHEKGAFTDASKSKSGLFELAENGTIFFDELAEMPLTIQAKLLKVLDTKIFRRVGGVVDLQSNTRFIGATNRDLAAQVKAGLFREDLYYRINVMPITLPPLRERGGDIIILAEHFIKLFAAEMGRTRLGASTAFMDALTKYCWPGNVRELKNVIERALILAEGDEVTVEHLPMELRSSRPLSPNHSSPLQMQTLQQIEDEHIRAVLHYTGNNHSRSATILGISRSTLLAKLKRLPTDKN
ncbi:MAG: sigma-54-dependent Fis family transcriptional regulator [Desulfuromonadales bacterium]|nr:sigma-54-dependent Fis family transcriptional regulator [Desulfuromonadales bacterium]